MVNDARSLCVSVSQLLYNYILNVHFVNCCFVQIDDSDIMSVRVSVNVKVNTLIRP
jgi:hypothetical protein